MKSERDSQNKTVLAHLQSGRGLTSWEAITRYHITRISARIKDLRYTGVAILSLWREREGKRFVEYRLAGADGLPKKSRKKSQSGERVATRNGELVHSAPFTPDLFNFDA